MAVLSLPKPSVWSPVLSVVAVPHDLSITYRAGPQRPRLPTVDRLPPCLSNWPSVGPDPSGLSVGPGDLLLKPGGFGAEDPLRGTGPSVRVDYQGGTTGRGSLS